MPMGPRSLDGVGSLGNVWLDPTSLTPSPQLSPGGLPSVPFPGINL